MTHPSRRTVLSGAFATALAAAAIAPRARADDGDGWHSVDISGSVPVLDFAMTDATTGKPVTGTDFRGKIAMLYLGYTFCPDICPLTLNRVADVLHALGGRADAVRFLFVTVDPDRDTLAVLHDYTSAFGPDFVGLRGDEDAIARLARRYRLAYSVDKGNATTPYAVTHSSAVYVFDRDGNARLLVPSLASTTPDIDGTTADLRRLIDGASEGWFSRMISSL